MESRSKLFKSHNTAMLFDDIVANPKSLFEDANFTKINTEKVRDLI